jgi:hypothetical protein
MELVMAFVTAFVTVFVLVLVLVLVKVFSRVRVMGSATVFVMGFSTASVSEHSRPLYPPHT